ncbi:unnamed protein product [Candidula unifasciata]|uniref:Uncharacterized protein n=1 Tax=Candidula unifasciata TaxID=100452 RepID=A0A8S4A2K3_9EUPU|nr:unnamed protein product [Candidula unifasciata]
MLYTDDDDPTLKTPVVRPNDILDIDISPVTSAASVCWQYGFDCKEALQEAVSKPKVKGKKASGDLHSKGGVHMGSPVKRGDPFLPSVFPDENPIADYNVKKNSRKKPSDCKCKGSGYNLSPSALLPEEMRQQWGVGMFGKPTLSRSNVISSSACCNKRDADAKSSQPNMVRAGDGCASSSCCVLRCKSCMRDPCACSEIFTKADGFRIPEINVTRKQKTSTKTAMPKSKENKSMNSLLLGNTNSVSVLKRVTVYNKDNNNIISTSNFHRNNTSSVPGAGHSSSTTEMNGYKSGLMASQSSSIRRSLNGSLAGNTRKLNYSTHEHLTTFPRARHRQQQPVQTRRHLPSVTSPPILATTGLRVPSSMLENKSPMSRSASQMFMMGNQGCTCDSCRQRANLMSKMEELGFSTSHAQQMLPSFMLEASQRYQSAILRSALSTSGRYAPYNVPGYSRYGHTSSSVYCSPERYQSSSPSVYNYSDSPGMKSQTATSTTPLSVAHQANNIDTSYLDSSISLVASPTFSGFGEDITDLSIKDTVDFFVSMKSPFLKFSSAAPPEAFSVLCSSMSSGEHSVSPRYNTSSSPWYCSAGVCGSSYTMSPVSREAVYDSYHKSEVSEAQTQPMSLLYSSLVSDLEDELRCAIENIPTT